MAVRQNASTGELVEDRPATKEPPRKSPDILNVKVWSPFRIYFDSQAASISGVNGTGAFDILPRHRNFITLLNPCDLVLQTRDGEVRIRISNGIMQVHKNTVIVFLEV